LDKEEKQELAPPEPMKVERTARRSMEELDEYLQSKRGVSGIPLVYVVREDETPGPDPGYGQPTMTKDLVNRAPHGNDNVVFKTDNTLSIQFSVL
jgi:hypothetical protein